MQERSTAETECTRSTGRKNGDIVPPITEREPQPEDSKPAVQAGRGEAPGNTTAYAHTATRRPHPSMRLADATLADLLRLIDAHRKPPANEAAPSAEALIDRHAAAHFLGISKSQLDKLIRELGLPFHWVGDVKRFDRAELRAWLMNRRRRGH